MQNPNRRLEDNYEHTSHSKDCKLIMVTCLVKADTAGVVKALLWEIIPRYKIHKTKESDRSSEQVERMNRTLKNKIARTWSQVGLKWPEVLGIALWDISNTSRQPLGLTNLLEMNELPHLFWEYKNIYEKIGHKPDGFSQYQLECKYMT
ncbi:hypothetical protein QYF61_024810 [Mycteria americana]|uniref:Uncharacterized protein n=1 Tax=Mycteria americana TaxID=33587 RepID=A0AAN7SAB6_MYCAM|nr:hypothetical protein QYF61_024810 [Mycteria americana]